MSSGSLVNEVLKAWAVPWKEARTESGMFISFCDLINLAAASPNEASGARLKEMVTHGKLPLVVDRQGRGPRFKMLNALNGTAPPLAEVT